MFGYLFVGACEIVLGKGLFLVRGEGKTSKRYTYGVFTVFAYQVKWHWGRYFFLVSPLIGVGVGRKGLQQ